jgi:hypothetical protein
VLTDLTGQSGIIDCLLVILIAPLKVQSAGVRAILIYFLGKPMERFQRKPRSAAPNPLPQRALLFLRRALKSVVKQHPQVKELYPAVE